MGLGRLIVEASRQNAITHTHAHTHTVGLLLTSDQLVTEAATYTTQNKHKRRTSMPSARFYPTITAMKQLQTKALDRTAIRIGFLYIVCNKSKNDNWKNLLKYSSVVFFAKFYKKDW